MEFRPILSALLRNKTGPVLVALQVALSLGILANATDIVNQRRAIAARPSGLSDEHSTFYLTVRNLADDSPETQLANIKRRADVLRAVGGVVSVANINQMPLSRSGWNTGVAVKLNQLRESAVASTYSSGDSLVQTFGLKLVDGRDFLPQERVDVNDATATNNPPQVIVTRPLADKLWPGQSAVGKTLYYGIGPDDAGAQVVGVVDRLMTTQAEASERGEDSVIMPGRSYGATPFALYAVRTEPGQRDRVIKVAEDALRKSSATPLIMTTTTVDDDRRKRYRADVALQWTLVAVSLLLLLITCSGIVGMASLWVTQRRKQIGVRRALGARRIDILRYFLFENFMITSAGVFGGVAFGLGLNQLLVSQLEMTRLPAGYLISGALGFWLLGLAAAYGPAWRGASISPATATRSV